MLRTTSKVIAASAVIAIAAAACGSSKSSTTPPTTGTTTGAAPATGAATGVSGGGKAIKVGVITDVTGLAASGEAHIEDGLKAGVAAAKDQGYDISYVIGDSKTSPTDVLAAAKKLVEQDHVDVILGSSAVLFGATTYLTSKNIPVVGFPQDGPEWLKSPNMFSNVGLLDTTKVTTTTAQFFKDRGATTVGAIGYSISPTSAESAKAAGVSAEAVGLKAGYINSKVPFGSTDVQPIALAMKNAGVDAVTTATDPNSSFALLGALKALNVNLKAAMLPIGYGGDLLEQGGAIAKDIENAYFTVQFQPIEMNTPGTQKFLKYLKDTGGTQAPGLPPYTAYTSLDLLVQGLKNVSGDLTSANIIAGLNKVTSWDAAGLLDKPFNPRDPANSGGPNNCIYIVQVVGGKFQLVSGADPVCGQPIPGKTVSP
ncbi:MAG TPA: ABC transporter substrate-binding protein [Mycobacteriales bacterium]|nr:ABC transporter substrate-binding protein [Mycobacteriales bacterium]